MLLDIDYVEAFKAGFMIIRDAPIQFFIFLVVVFVGIWLLVFRSFKHALEIQTSLKDGYKEKFESLEKDHNRLKVTAAVSQEEANRLRSQRESTRESLEKLSAPIPKPKTELPSPPPQVGATSLSGLLGLVESTPDNKIKGLEADIERCKKDVKRYQDMWEEELREHLSANFQYAALKMILIGSEQLTSRDLSVLIQFIDLNDSGLAENIQGWFRSGTTTPPWKTSITQIQWQKNPSGKARILISSDDDTTAVSLKDAFNMHNLIPEKVETRQHAPSLENVTVTIFTEPKTK